MTTSTRTLRGEGIQLSCDIYGAETQPAVLLLHGGGQTRHAWRRAARALQASGMCAITADQRGHGNSDWAAADEYEIGHFAADVAALCRRLPGSPVIVGASLGGLAALIAVGESEVPLARALVLVDIAPRIETAGAQRILEFMNSGTTGFKDLDSAPRLWLTTCRSAADPKTPLACSITCASARMAAGTGTGTRPSCANGSLLTAQHCRMNMRGSPRRPAISSCQPCWSAGTAVTW